jgi:hypothetical protein
MPMLSAKGPLSGVWEYPQLPPHTNLIVFSPKLSLYLKEVGSNGSAAQYDRRLAT